MASDYQTKTTRRYQQRKRAESQAQTRHRITEAAMDLHGTVGPARTTISAIADRAGVRRATVYRHFPDERALFQACSGMFNEANPPPDPAQWSSIDDPERRLATALDALYGWYERVGHMLANVVRDAPAMPILREIGAPRATYLARLEDELARGWGARGRRARSLRAAISLALDFSTWRALHDRDVERGEAVRLMIGLVRMSGSRQ
jgi:AcrR family transcriptional regulator